MGPDEVERRIPWPTWHAVIRYKIRIRKPEPAISWLFPSVSSASVRGKSHPGSSLFYSSPKVLCWFIFTSCSTFQQSPPKVIISISQSSSPNREVPLSVRARRIRQPPLHYLLVVWLPVVSRSSSPAVRAASSQPPPPRNCANPQIPRKHEDDTGPAPPRIARDMEKKARQGPPPGRPQKAVKPKQTAWKSLSNIKDYVDKSRRNVLSPSDVSKKAKRPGNRKGSQDRKDKMRGPKQLKLYWTNKKKTGNQGWSLGQVVGWFCPGS